MAALGELVLKHGLATGGLNSGLAKVEQKIRGFAGRTRGYLCRRCRRTAPAPR
jgi:hypothetical protein